MGAAAPTVVHVAPPMARASSVWTNNRLSMSGNNNNSIKYSALSTCQPSVLILAQPYRETN